MGLLDRLKIRSFKRERWIVPLEGSTTPPGMRPAGWEVPPKLPGDSSMIMTKGEKDGTHVTVRLPKNSSSERRG